MGYNLDLDADGFLHVESGSPEDHRFRWWLYNVTFWLFGRKPFWDRLSQFLW